MSDPVLILVSQPLRLWLCLISPGTDPSVSAPSHSHECSECVCVCDAPLCFRSGARRPRRRRVPHQPHALGDERQQTQPGDRRSPVQPSGSVRAQQRYPSCPALSHCVCVCVCVCVVMMEAAAENVLQQDFSHAVKLGVKHTQQIILAIQQMSREMKISKRTPARLFTATPEMLDYTRQ